jgi:hypothetical protein
VWRPGILLTRALPPLAQGFWHGATRPHPDGWHDEWPTLAERIAGEARCSEKRGYRVSGRDSFLRASDYYRMAGFFLHGNPADPPITIAFDLSVACFRNAAALFDPRIEPVQIPFEGTTLPRYFCRGFPELRTLIIWATAQVSCH